MKTLAKFLLSIFFVFLLLSYLFPAPAPELPRSQSAQSTQAPVTLAEVTEKSKDALITTATFMGQEKSRIAAHMGVTLRKLDQLINHLQTMLANAPATERPLYQRRLKEWQATRGDVVQLQNNLAPAENSAVETLKAKWQDTRVEISGKLLRENTPVPKS